MAVGGKPHLERVAALEQQVSELLQRQRLLVERLEAAQRELAPDRHDSERRFRTLATHSPMGIFQIDLEGNLLYANDRFRTIAGIKPDESEAENCSRSVHPHDIELVRRAWQRAMETQGEFAAEYRFRHEDGTLRWVWCSAVPLCDEAGTATSYLGNVLDITERKTVEAELREAEQRFRLLANSSPVGIFLADDRGRVVYTNPRLQVIYRYAAHELEGIGFARVFTAEDREAALQNWLRVATTTAATQCRTAHHQRRRREALGPRPQRAADLARRGRDGPRRQRRRHHRSPPS